MSASARQAGNTGGGFLKFNSKPPRIYLTSEDPDFDPFTIQQWKSEGFDVQYLPFDGDLKVFKNQLMHIGDDLEIGEHYALIAYESAATAALDACIKPHHHMVALIAYYPTTVPAPKVTFPQQMELLIHLAGTQGFGSAHRNYIYPDTEVGFAESDLDEYERVSANLAWSRTLATIRKAFRIDVDLEPLWDEYLGSEFERRDAVRALSTMVEEPCVNHVPTLTGGIGRKELFRFYQDHFVNQNPPMKMRLISRTIGVDRVVDEMVISFRHTQRMDWILPDVPPTNKFVQVAMVCVAAVRGGKLDKESLYWDQASVLVQIGLLNPKLVPDSMKQKGLKRLPVYGVESAQKVLNEQSLASNQLITSWRQARTQPRRQMNGGKSKRPESPD
ncbi:hypothetical protein AAFC00_001644 [Neodothiora populina]|uniref:Dienelactone hydrolase n=1 Tax=Neodothiora populina TaxID=2781224 RepID=A0ABR3PPN8_9PEZI